MIIIYFMKSKNYIKKLKDTDILNLLLVHDRNDNLQIWKGY